MLGYLYDLCCLVLEFATCFVKTWCDLACFGSFIAYGVYSEMGAIIWMLSLHQCIAKVLNFDTCIVQGYIICLEIALYSVVYEIFLNNKRCVYDCSFSPMKDELQNNVALWSWLLAVFSVLAHVLKARIVIRLILGFKMKKISLPFQGNFIPLWLVPMDS